MVRCTLFFHANNLTRVTLAGAANLAGIAETRKTKAGKFPIESIDDDDWETIMKTNLDGVKNCLRAQFRAIEGPGAIVNASSTAGQYGPPNCGPYVVSKWGVIGLTKTVAREVGRRGIRVNAVAP
jgi:NAD(P)-dependent dehydrogenase (short-subunit alcohol dehydrogenase family)